MEFIGDAILAVWTDRETERSSAVAALVAATQMQSKLRRLNQSWKVRQYPPISVRIGVASGLFFAG